MVEQAARRRAHDQRGHEVLEHRARPRDQGRPAADRRQRPAEPEPVIRRRRRPWRSRGSWPAAPRRRAGRSSSGPACRPGPGSRWRTACGSGRTGTLKSISRNSCSACSAIARRRRIEVAAAAGPHRAGRRPAGRPARRSWRGRSPAAVARAGRGRARGCPRSCAAASAQATSSRSGSSPRSAVRAVATSVERARVRRRALRAAPPRRRASRARRRRRRGRRRRGPRRDAAG